jgi:endonuclease III
MKSTSASQPKSNPNAKSTAKPLTKRSAPKKRALEILARLTALYPEAPCSLDYHNPFQLMVATILAAQCTDERVNKVTPALFDRYPDIESFAGADLDELESYVRSTGFFRNKAKNIRAASQRILEVYGGDVPRSMAELITLGGVARKTANVVLAHGFGIHEGVTVDTHVKRLSGRLGLTAYSDPIRVERDLMALLPQPDWENWSIRLVYHGRAVCDARKPACDRCVLRDICPGSAA